MINRPLHNFTPKWREAIRDRIEIENNVTLIKSADDLPEPVDGKHKLVDGVTYRFIGEVESDSPIELGTATPLIGHHRETDWFIYTGGSGAAIRGTDVNFIHTNMSINAPGANIFDLDGGTDSECLVDSVYYADDQERGNISDLGTIKDFRSPLFSKVNIRDFDAGITFTGTTGKISFNGGTIRDVTESSVTALTFDSDLTADAIGITNSFIRNVQNDTKVVDVDGSATVDEVFLYTGNSHDDTVTKSNILTGAADATNVGYYIQGSPPLRDSSVVGEVALDSTNTTTISSADTWTTIDGNFNLGSELERVSQDSGSILKYDGDRDVNVHIQANISFVQSDNDTVQIGIFKNGTVEPNSVQEGDGAASTPIPIGCNGVEDLATDDTVSIRIKNVDNANDISVRRFNMSFLG